MFDELRHWHKLEYLLADEWRTNGLIVTPINLYTMGKIVVGSFARCRLVKLRLADACLLCPILSNDLIALGRVEKLGGKDRILRSIASVEDWA